MHLRPPAPTAFPYATLFRSPRHGPARWSRSVGGSENRTRPRRAEGGSQHGRVLSEVVVRTVRLPRIVPVRADCPLQPVAGELDRKSTRLNSSHSQISYAVFC